MVEQSNPGGRRLRSTDLVAVFCFCCVCAELAAIVENTPKPSSARNRLTRTIKTPIKMRRLKKAERVEGRFSILQVWGDDVQRILRSRGTAALAVRAVDTSASGDLKCAVACGLK